VLYQPESIPNLQVLVGRPIIADSVKAEILNSGKMRTLLEQFRATSEPTIVLIDTPPVLLGDDVIVMAPMVDAFMLVVEEGGTQVDDLQKSLELLAEYEIMGTILNNSDEKTHRMEGYYQSDS
jgi:Mrp family chromosome partitioning ATPase